MGNIHVKSLARFCKIHFLIFFGLSIQASDCGLTVFNHTHMPMYAGLYSVKATLFNKSIGPATRYQNVTCIMPGNQSRLNRPPYEFKKNREIIFSTNTSDLKLTLEKKEYRLASKKSAGFTQGTTYHIVQVDGIFKILENSEWKKFVTSYNPQGNPNDNKQIDPNNNDRVAMVRQGTALNIEEEAAVLQRLSLAKDCLERLFNISLKEKDVPRIAVCLSGGGMRAATCSLGLLEGLNNMGLLDAIIWAAALSGSTWLISHYCHYNKPFKEYCNLFLDVATSMDSFSTGAVKELLGSRLYNEYGITLVDCYGAYLAHKFLRNIQSATERQRVHFSDLKTQLNQDCSIIPLCTAVEITNSKHNPVWFSFTPFEVGSEELGLYVPTWAFGRKFFNGSSTNDVPEKTLGYFMGLWGSALSGTLKQMFEHVLTQNKLNKSLYNFLKKILNETIGPVRFAPIKVCNPFYGIEESFYKNLSNLNFVDAGYHFNLPLPPLLYPERAVDVIIILDVSKNVHVKEGCGALHKAYNYVRQKGLPFPQIDGKVDKDAINVFFEPDKPGIPLVIYVPVFNNVGNPGLIETNAAFSSEYDSIHFTYSKNACQDLITLVSAHIGRNQELIKNAILLKINQKQACGGEPS